MFYIQWTQKRKEKVGYDYINGKREERYDWTIVNTDVSSCSYDSYEEAKRVARSESFSHNSSVLRHTTLEYDILYVKEEGDPPELEKMYGSSDESVSFTKMYIHYFFKSNSTLKTVIGIVLIPLIIVAVFYLWPYLLLLGIVAVVGYCLWNLFIDSILPGIIGFLKIAAVCTAGVTVFAIISCIVGMICG